MKNKRKIFLGIEILRMIFSFHILTFHCINKNLYKSRFLKIIISNVDYDLITFYIISFYFSYSTFYSKNIQKIKHRFKRLLIPYYIWPIFYYIIKNFVHYISKKVFKITLKYLYYQILIGNGLFFVFWFQFNLIIISLLFLIIIFIIKKNLSIYFLLILVFSYVFLCSSYQRKIKLNYNKIISFSINPISSTIIFSLTGIFLYSINIYDKINRKKNKTIFISLIILFLISYYKKLIINKIPYFNIFIKDLFSISIFIIFLILPFEKIKNRNYIKVIKQLTSYTAGIYYLHTKTISLKKYINKNISNSLIICIMNYLLCYFICFIGAKIFKNSYYKYLFL